MTYRDIVNNPQTEDNEYCAHLWILRNDMSVYCHNCGIVASILKKRNKTPK